MVVMFSKSLRSLSLLFGLILMSLNVSAADSMELNGQELVLGEGLTLTVRGENAVKQLENYEFSELKKHFVIDTVDSRSDRLRVKFYPYQVGDYVFPAIQLNGVTLDERLIKVVKNTEVVVKWHEIPESLFFQQSIVQTADVELPSDEWRLIPETHLMDKTLREKWDLDVIDSIQQEENQYQLTTIMNYRGFVEPLTQVQESIPAAHIKVRRPNGRYWHFYSPLNTVQLNPLPSFLPADALVADLYWQSSKPAITVYKDVNYWHWKMQAENVSSAYLTNVAQEVVRQLSEIKSVIWLSPEIQSEQRLIEKEGDLVLQQSLQLTIPFRPQQWFWQQPEIHLGFVSPESKKWQVEILLAGWKVSLPESVFWVLWIIGFMLLMWVVKRLFKAGRAFWFWQKMQNDCRKAHTSAELLRALFAWQLSQQTQTDLRSISSHSCEQWLGVYQSNATSEGAFVRAQELMTFAQQSLYAPLDEDESYRLEHLKAKCQQWCQAESVWQQMWRALK